MTKRTIIMILSTLAVLIGAQWSVARSEPIVLGDEGNTVSTRKYVNQYRVAVEKTQTYDPALALRQAERKENGTGLDWTALLPIKTPELTPGAFESNRAHKRAGVQPFCIVGYDEFSIEWVLEVKSVLLENNAVCFIVNVETIEELNELREAISPVPWQLLRGGTLARQLGIKHYPVLISRMGIEQ